MTFLQREGWFALNFPSGLACSELAKQVNNLLTKSRLECSGLAKNFNGLLANSDLQECQ
jgi:hypothetical protein